MSSPGPTLLQQKTPIDYRLWGRRCRSLSSTAESAMTEDRGTRGTRVEQAKDRNGMPAAVVFERMKAWSSIPGRIKPSKHNFFQCLNDFLGRIQVNVWGTIYRPLRWDCDFFFVTVILCWSLHLLGLLHSYWHHKGFRWNPLMENRLHKIWWFFWDVFFLRNKSSLAFLKADF